jgi:hypothetical protein
VSTTQRSSKSLLVMWCSAGHKTATAESWTTVEDHDDVQYVL